MYAKRASGLLVPDVGGGDPDKDAMGYLRDVMNAAATEISASPMACVATVALLAAQLCHKHAGADVAKQDAFLDDLVGAAKHSLHEEGYRPKMEA